MSVEARRWVERHSPVRGTARQVLEHMAWYADAKGCGARRSQLQIAEATGRGRATVQRALTRLRSEGHIRPHAEDCACKDCRRAGRGVVVYDVVLGLQDDVARGQLVLTPTGLNVRPVKGSDRPHSEAGQVPQDEAGTGLILRHPLTTLRPTANNEPPLTPRKRGEPELLPVPPKGNRARGRASWRAQAFELAARHGIEPTPGVHGPSRLERLLAHAALEHRTPEEVRALAATPAWERSARIAGEPAGAVA